MKSPISKTQIDRLGDRLRKGNITDDDLRLLDEYRRSFTDTYERVVGSIRQQLGLEPTGRPAKSTTSIAEKLRRESIRLTQIQDIAGCRLIVSDIAEQERVKSSLVEIIPGCTVVDRRQKPSHGYRAVHVIAVTEGKAVEIQIRTALQQAWAESCEKLADVIEPAIKYGGGDSKIQTALTGVSEAIARFEARDYSLWETQKQLEHRLSQPDLTDNQRAAIMSEQEKAIAQRASLRTLRDEVLNDFRQVVDELEE